MHLWRLIQSGSDLLNLTEFCTRDRVPPRRSKVSSKMTLARSKQMRITKEEIVAGHSAIQVRGLLRRLDGMFFTRSAVESVMRFKPEQAERLINEMASLELIEPTTTFKMKWPLRLLREAWHSQMRQPQSQSIEEQPNGS
jgi:hypothetical protein